MFIDKQFYGDLDAISVVADSRTLHGRKGTFLLQHSGVMTRGTPHISEDFRLLAGCHRVRDAILRSEVEIVQD